MLQDLCRVRNRVRFQEGKILMLMDEQMMS